MVKQLGFILDTNRCLGCGACIKACHTNHELPPALQWRQLRQIEEGDTTCIRRFFLSTACNHCANPECLRVCPSGAYYKRRDGIVLHSPEKCASCKSCISSCPFGAPKLNPVTRKAGKCQLCYERIDQGRPPYCVQACITGALRLEEILPSDDNQLLRLTAPTPSVRLTKPSVYYKLPRGTKLK